MNKNKGKAAVFLIFLLLILSACSTNDDKISASQTEGTQKAMGRFMEDEYMLPSDMALLYDMVKMKDGRLRCIGSTSEMEAPIVFDSDDNGQTWEKCADETACLSGDKYFVDIKLAADGRMMISYFLTEELGGEGEANLRYCYVDENGKEKELDLKLPEIKMEGELATQAENSLNRFQFGEDGSLYGVDVNQSVLHMDTATGEVLESYDNPNVYVESIGITGKYLFIYTSDGIEQIDLEKKESLGIQDIFNEYLETKDEDVIVTGISSHFVFAPGNKEDEILFCNSNGLYRYIVGGNVIEQVINGNLNSMSSPNTYYKSLIAMEDNTFFLTCEDNGSLKLFKYTYREDVPTVPDTELKVYSLNDSTTLRQMITSFQKEHPDVYVSLEIGLSGDDAMTTADALRTLNTNIMAGKGPDVLCLDGMPVNNYIEKGLLVDMKDIVDEISETDGLFENVTNTFKNDDGIFALPVEIFVPIMIGKSENTDKVSDLKTMADQIEDIREKNPDANSITGTNSAKELAERMYPSSSPSWMREDGTLDEEKLKEFMTELKRIYDADRVDNDSDDTVNYGVISFGGDGKLVSSSSIDAMSFASKDSLFSIGVLNNLNDLSAVYSSAKAIAGASYGLMPGQSQNVFCPNMVMGINSKSSKQDTAKEFVKSMLSAQSQMSRSSEGIPVNKTAFTQMQESPYGQSEEANILVGIVSDDGDYFEMDIEWPTTEEFEKLKSWIESLNTPSVVDNTIKDAVMEAVENCLDGTDTVDESVDKIMQKVNLYLSE